MCSRSRTWHRPDSRTRSPAGPVHPTVGPASPAAARSAAGSSERRTTASRVQDVAVNARDVPRARSQAGAAHPAAQALQLPWWCLTAQPNLSCLALGRQLGVSAVLASVFALASWPDKENRGVRVRGTLQDLASPDASAQLGRFSQNGHVGPCAGDQDRGQESARAQAARSQVKCPDARLASCNYLRMQWRSASPPSATAPRSTFRAGAWRRRPGLPWRGCPQAPRFTRPGHRMGSARRRRCPAPDGNVVRPARRGCLRLDSRRVICRPQHGLSCEENGVPAQRSSTLDHRVSAPGPSPWSEEADSQRARQRRHPAARTPARLPASRWDDPRLPWAGRPRAADIALGAAITASGVHLPLAAAVPGRTGCAPTRPLLQVLNALDGGDRGGRRVRAGRPRNGAGRAARRHSGADGVRYAVLVGLRAVG